MIITNDIKLKLRNILEFSPMFVHKALTLHFASNASGFIMTDEDRDKCLNDENTKHAILTKYKTRYPSQVKRMNRYIDKLYASKSVFNRLNEAEKAEIIKDMEFCWFAYGFQIDEYIFFDLAGVNKSPESRALMVSDAERLAFRFCANDFTYTALSDKSTAYKLLKKYYKRDIVAINDRRDLHCFEEFISRHSRFVQKAVSSSRGEGVKLIDLSEVQGGKNAYFGNLISQGRFLLEEIIEQTDDMKQFNSDSVNTVRVSTFITRDGVEAPFGFFRTGRSGSFIDNAATGGVFATVDCKQGMVISDGCDELGNRYSMHPDSKIKIRGFKLPSWEEAISLVKEAALLAPNLKYLSWDLAHSKAYGWVIVEVNTSGQFLQQAGTLTGIRKEFKQIIDNMDLIVPFSLRD